MSFKIQVLLLRVENQTRIDISLRQKNLIASLITTRLVIYPVIPLTLRGTVPSVAAFATNFKFFHHRCPFVAFGAQGKREHEFSCLSNIKLDFWCCEMSQSKIKRAGDSGKYHRSHWKKVANVLNLAGKFNKKPNQNQTKVIPP